MTSLSYYEFVFFFSPPTPVSHTERTTETESSLCWRTENKAISLIVFSLEVSLGHPRALKQASLSPGESEDIARRMCEERLGGAL